jgi:hypothetical protein
VFFSLPPRRDAGSATSWWLRKLKEERLIEATMPGRNPKVKYRLRQGRHKKNRRDANKSDA